MTVALDENLLALSKARRIPFRRKNRMTPTMNDTERFAYGPADQEALERRNALAAAAVQMEQSLTPAAMQHLEDQLRLPILAEREATHGNFAATALIAQRFKDVSKNTPNWNGNLTDVQRETLEAIFTKIARILSGDPNFPDHWRDIEGQARLASEQLP